MMKQKLSLLIMLVAMLPQLAFDQDDKSEHVYTQSSWQLCSGSVYL